MASTYLNKTFSTTGDRQKFTLSMWFKRGIVPDGNQAGTERMLFNAYQDSSNQDQIWLQTNGTINYVRNNANAVTPSQVFRDPSAWYHVVFAGDTTQGSNADRLKVYINGTQATIGQQDTITQGSNFGAINNAQLSTFGRRNGSNDWYFDGLMANVEMVDGQQYGPEYFGSTDSNTGIWKPGGSSAISNYGTNGYKLAMDTTSPGADTSGKGNTFTPSGTPTLTQGSPSNVWANMATPTWYDGTIANGGNTISTNQSNYRYQTSSIGVNKGKWYWEVKLSTAADYALMGITCDPNPTNTSSNWILGSGASDYSVVYNTAGGNGNKYNNAGTSPTNTPGAFMGGFAAGNIIMFALDCDNNTLKIGTNNSWSNGSGSTNQTFSNTTPISITDPTATNTGFYFASVGDYGGGTSVFQFNFGEGFFATTAAGTQADDNGQGLFAYDVPAGYYALNTKNLEAYG